MPVTDGCRVVDGIPRWKCQAQRHGSLLVCELLTPLSQQGGIDHGIAPEEARESLKKVVGIGSYKVAIACNRDPGCE